MTDEEMKRLNAYAKENALETDIKDGFFALKGFKHNKDDIVLIVDERKIGKGICYATAYNNEIHEYIEGKTFDELMDWLDEISKGNENYIY